MKRKRNRIIACSATGGSSLSNWLTLRRKPEPLAPAKEETSPFLVEFFMVEGAGFQCMAYRNADGKWRTAFDNIELRGTVRVVG